MIPPSTDHCAILYLIVKFPTQSSCKFHFNRIMAGSQARNDKVPCDGCDMVFNRRADMERHHELKHKGKRYFCGHPGCDYSAGRAYTRNSHREKKHKEAFECESDILIWVEASRLILLLVEVQLAGIGETEQRNSGQHNIAYVQDTAGKNADCSLAFLLSTNGLTVSRTGSTSTPVSSTGSSSTSRNTATNSWTQYGHLAAGNLAQDEYSQSPRTFDSYNASPYQGNETYVENYQYQVDSSSAYENTSYGEDSNIQYYHNYDGEYDQNGQWQDYQTSGRYNQ